MSAAQVYTVAEVMEVLACSRSTVNRMLADGQLTRSPVRGGVRIPIADVDAIVAGKPRRRRRSAA